MTLPDATARALNEAGWATVDYADRSQLLLRIELPSGAVLMQHPAHVPPA